jgi:flagellar hook-length control protein FliK
MEAVRFTDSPQLPPGTPGVAPRAGPPEEINGTSAFVETLSRELQIQSDVKTVSSSSRAPAPGELQEDAKDKESEGSGEDGTISPVVVAVPVPPQPVVPQAAPDLIAGFRLLPVPTLESNRGASPTLSPNDRVPLLNLNTGAAQSESPLSYPLAEAGILPDPKTSISFSAAQPGHPIPPQRSALENSPMSVLDAGAAQPESRLSPRPAEDGILPDPKNSISFSTARSGQPIPAQTSSLANSPMHDLDAGEAHPESHLSSQTAEQGILPEAHLSDSFGEAELSQAIAPPRSSKANPPMRDAEKLSPAPREILSEQLLETGEPHVDEAESAAVRSQDSAQALTTKSGPDVSLPIELKEVVEEIAPAGAQLAQRSSLSSGLAYFQVTEPDAAAVGDAPAIAVRKQGARALLHAVVSGAAHVRQPLLKRTPEASAAREHGSPGSSAKQPTGGSTNSTPKLDQQTPLRILAFTPVSERPVEGPRPSQTCPAEQQNSCNPPADRNVFAQGDKPHAGVKASSMIVQEVVLEGGTSPFAIAAAPDQTSNSADKTPELAAGPPQHAPARDQAGQLATVAREAAHGTKWQAESVVRSTQLSPAARLIHTAQLLERPDRAEMRILLQADELGVVELRTHVRGDHVGATIAVDKPEAQSLLAKELSSLHQALSDRQLRVEDLSVCHGSLTLGSDGSGKAHSQSEQSDQQQSQPASGPAGPTLLPERPLPELWEIPALEGRLSVRA